MARYLGPKHKHCRREGVPLCGNPKCPVARNPNPPGQHGQKRRRKISSYGEQLREKQKAKRTFGVLEKQFRRYVKKAQKKKGKTGETILQLLETRLDNVIYRLGLAPTRRMARQLVSHTHVLIDEQKVDIPSYSVKPGQIITLKPKSLEIPVVKKNLQATKNDSMPAWLEKKGPVGRIKRLPNREEMDQNINEQLIVEYYSR